MNSAHICLFHTVLGSLLELSCFGSPSCSCCCTPNFGPYHPEWSRKLALKRERTKQKTTRASLQLLAIATLLYYVVFQAQMMMIADFTLDCFQFFLPLSRGGGETESHKESLGWWLLVGKNYENIYLFFYPKRIERGLFYCRCFYL